MIIFDAHLDMAWNACEWNRDLMQPVNEIRQFENQFQGIIPGDCTVSWHELRRGRVGLTTSTLLPRLHRKDQPLSHFRSREAAYASAYGQLAYYRALAERSILSEISDLESLEQHVNCWEQSDAEDLPIGYILSMEGSPPVLSPSQIPECGTGFNWFVVVLILSRLEIDVST